MDQLKTGQLSKTWGGSLLDPKTITLYSKPCGVWSNLDNSKLPMAGHELLSVLPS